MSVNQRIKDLLKHGDVKKISEILEISGQSVTERINSSREIDSVDFINAVCKITEKPFSYFKKVYGMVSVSDEELEHMVLEDERLYVKKDAFKSAADYWQNEYRIVKDQLERAQEFIQILQNKIE